MHYNAKISDIYKYVKLRENSSNQTPEKKFGPFSWKQSGRSKEQVKVILNEIIETKISAISAVTDLLFYPRDAMLARVLATALCLSVCHKSVFYRN